MSKTVLCIGRRFGHSVNEQPVVVTPPVQQEQDIMLFVNMVTKAKKERG